VAQRQRAVGLFIFGGKASVTITINTYTPTAASGNSLWDYWNVGNHLANAETLLHELGHAFNDLFGRGGSQIVRDADRFGRSTASAQEFNANLLKTNCFKSAP
jgi:hypothetical protein